MSSSLFSPLKNAVLAFFKHDVALRRGDAGVRLVLEDRLRQPAGKTPTRAEQVAQKDSRELTQARAELDRVLSEEPLMRSQLRHLAFIEHALEKKGWRGLYKVPLSVLTQALAQLEEQVTNWSPEGLACLRSKMAVAVIDREQQGSNHESDMYNTAAVLESAPMLATQAIETAKASAEDDDAALMAAYAAYAELGDSVPGALDVQGELGSASAQAATQAASRAAARDPHEPASAIRLRDLQT